MKRFLIILLFALAACTPREHFPVLQGEDAGSVAVTGIKSSNNERADKILNFKALYRLQIVHSSEMQTSRVAINFSKPVRYLLEFYPTTSFYLLQKTVIADGQFLSLDMTNARAERGGANAGTLEGLIGIPVEPEDLSRILFGILPDAPMHGFIDPKSKETRLAGDFNDVYAELLTGTTVPSKIKYFDKEGVKQFEVGYEQYREYAGISVPTKVILTIPKASTTVELTASTIRINEGVKDDLYHVVVPDGFVLLDAM